MLARQVIVQFVLYIAIAAMFNDFVVIYFFDVRLLNLVFSRFLFKSGAIHIICGPLIPTMDQGVINDSKLGEGSVRRNLDVALPVIQ